MERWAWLLLGETIWSGFGLLAQAGHDPISGGAGWVGAGLLGLVLGWLLLKHLPDKDRQIKELTDGKDVHVKDLIDKWLGQTVRMGADYKADLDRVTTHCEKEMQLISSNHEANIRVLTDSWRREMSYLTAAVEKAYQERVLGEEDSES